MIVVVPLFFHGMEGGNGGREWREGMEGGNGGREEKKKGEGKKRSAERMDCGFKRQAPHIRIQRQKRYIRGSLIRFSTLFCCDPAISFFPLPLSSHDEGNKVKEKRAEGRKGKRERERERERKRVKGKIK